MGIKALVKFFVELYNFLKVYVCQKIKFQNCMQNWNRIGQLRQLTFFTKQNNALNNTKIKFSLVIVLISKILLENEISKL